MQSTKGANVQKKVILFIVLLINLKKINVGKINFRKSGKKEIALQI